MFNLLINDEELLNGVSAYLITDLISSRYEDTYDELMEYFELDFESMNKKVFIVLNVDELDVENLFIMYDSYADAKNTMRKIFDTSKFEIDTCKERVFRY